MLHISFHLIIILYLNDCHIHGIDHTYDMLLLTWYFTFVACSYCLILFYFKYDSTKPLMLAITWILFKGVGCKGVQTALLLLPTFIRCYAPLLSTLALLDMFLAHAGLF